MSQNLSNYNLDYAITLSGWQIDSVIHKEEKSFTILKMLMGYTTLEAFRQILATT